MQEQLDRLKALATRHAGPIPAPTAIPRLTLARACGATKPLPGVYEPMHALVLQGAKEVTIGEQRLRYDPASYFVASVDLPAAGCIVKATVEEPYLAVALSLDRDLLASLLPDVPAQKDEAASAGFAVSAVTPALLDPWLRLLQLLDTPADIPVLAPMLEREILYRLLQGPQGAMLRQIARADSRLSQVRRTIGWIRTHYDQPLKVEQLADLAGMSPASFHRHFKAVTAMSPLQFQKSLRLQQARRLLLAHRDACQAGYAVGYESASQFSREYARLFGAPPARDALRLRGEGASLSEAAGAA